MIGWIKNRIRNISAKDSIKILLPLSLGIILLVLIKWDEKEQYENSKSLQESYEKQFSKEKDTQNTYEENSLKVPVIVFNFDQTKDDERRTILKSYGFSATFADSSDSNYMKTLVEDGFDICPYLGDHSRDYSLEESKDAFVTQITNKMSTLESLGIDNPVMVLCSGHKYQWALDQALKETGYYDKFKYIRCGCYNLEQEHPSESDVYTHYYESHDSKYQFPWTIENYDTSEEMINALAVFLADERTEMIMPMMHTFKEDGGSDVTKQMFIDLCEYIKALENEGKVKVMNMRQYYAYYYSDETN